MTVIVITSVVKYSCLAKVLARQPAEAKTKAPAPSGPLVKLCVTPSVAPEESFLENQVTPAFVDFAPAFLAFAFSSCLCS